MLNKKVSQFLNILNLHILPKTTPHDDKWIFMFLVVLTAFLIRIKLIVGPHNPNITTLHTVFFALYGKLKHCCWFNNHAAVWLSVVFQQIRIACSLSWPTWVQGWQVALVIFSANVLSRFLAVSQKISADNLLNNLLLNNVKPEAASGGQIANF